MTVPPLRLPQRAPDPKWRWPVGAAVLGRTRNGQDIFVPPEMRQIHMHVVGASNQGKSKLLENLIRQDIVELDGMRRAVVVLDPHGTLIADVLNWYTTHGLHRVRPIRILDPGDPTHVFGMNPVRRREGVDPAVVASTVMNAMAKVWGGEDPRSTPQLRESLKAILYTLNALNLTLLDADELMGIEDNNGLRAFAIEQIDHPPIRRFWRTIDALPPARREEKLGSAVRRLNEFLLPQAVRNIIGQRDRVIDFRQVMDDGEVVLVNLGFDNGRISEDEAALLGTLIINDLFLSCLGRPKGATPTFLYIDECQRYLTQDIANILDQSRKFGLHAILAHQHLGHLREAGEHIYRSVMTNTRTKVIFGGLDDEDATLMARNVYRGRFDLQKPKPLYDKPVVVGQVTEWLRAESEGEGTAHAVGTNHSHGGSKATSRSTTKSRSTTYSESESIGESDTESDSHADSRSESESDSAGSSEGRSASSSISGEWGQQQPDSWSGSRGTDASTSATNGSGRTSGGSDTHSTAHASSVARSTGFAETEGEAETEGTTRGTSWSQGGSETDTASRQQTQGRSQALRSVLEVKPTQSYGLDDQVHIASVRIANLDLGEAIVKIGRRSPARINTVPVRPGWARPEHVARVKQRLFESTPYIMPIAEARALTAEQRQLLEAELRLKITFEPKKRARKKEAPVLKDDEWG